MWYRYKNNTLIKRVIIISYWPLYNFLLLYLDSILLSKLHIYSISFNYTYTSYKFQLITQMSFSIKKKKYEIFLKHMCINVDVLVAKSFSSPNIFLLFIFTNICKKCVWNDSTHAYSVHKEQSSALKLVTRIEVDREKRTSVVSLR